MGEEAKNSGWGGGAVAAGVVAAVIGVFGTLATVIVTYLNHQADINTKLIELSIGILQEEPKPETKPLRDWAINTLQARGIDFGKAQTDVLLKNQLPLTVGPWRGVIQQQALPPQQTPSQPQRSEKSIAASELSPKTHPENLGLVETLFPEGVGKIEPNRTHRRLP